MRKLTLLSCLFFGLLFGQTVDVVDIIAFQQLSGRVKSDGKICGLDDLQNKIVSVFPNSILIGLGNNYSGSFSSFRGDGQSFAAKLQKLNLKLNLISGEDLVFGLKEYLEFNKTSNSAVLCTNLKSEKKRGLQGISSTCLLEKNGYKILFVGGCAENLFINADITTTPLAEAVEAKISEIVSGGVIPNAIIVMLDIPASFDTFTRQILDDALRKISKIDGISAIFVNDNKSSSYSTNAGSVPIISTSVQEGEISLVKLSFDPKFRFLSSASSEIINLERTNEGNVIAENYESIATAASDISSKPTRVKFPTPLGKIVCRNLAESSKIDFVVIPQSIFKNSLSKDNVSDKDIYQIFETDHRLLTAKVSGKELKEIYSLILFQNKRYQYFAPELKSNQNEITSIKHSGFFGLSPVKDDAQYSVLTTQEGFDEFLVNGDKKSALKKSLVTSLLEELRGKILSAEPQN